ncbi:MAG: hypothetical protein A2W23_00115 [Planctomycetes bacterium RBG_16_43_13]|nr:MAG: hypothetical protein A2W23_00115 [Planctomycetes bacterium RBG_16_43_13]
MLGKWTRRDVMKKEIIICDKCGREIRKGDKYTQRPKDLHSSRISDIEDICRDCAYPTIDKYKPLFWKAANEEFWNIL